MADVEVKYRGQTIRAMSASGTEVLHTKEKYCDDDITIDYTSPGGGGANLQTKSVSYTPDETGISDTILPDPGYDGLDEVDVTVDAIPDTYVGSAVPQRDSSDLLVTGRLVRAPAGYYASMAGAQVAMGTEGTPTASKGAVSNHSVDVTPSVTNVAGYINGGTQTGSPVTVTAAELVSGSQTVTVNDTYDVTNLAEMVVNVSGGSGATRVAYGTVTPSGSSNTITINVGTTVPIRNFFVKIWLPTGTEIPYNTDNKVIRSNMIVDGTLGSMKYNATTGSPAYDRYAAAADITIDVNNSGTITQVIGYPPTGSVSTVRNNTAGSINITASASSPAWRVYSDHIVYAETVANNTYPYVNQTYNWEIWYYGTDPTNDFISV